MIATTSNAGRSPGWAGPAAGKGAGSNVAWALAGGLALSLLGVAWGFAVAVGEEGALLLCAAAIACLFVFLDFRVGVVLLVLSMPFSASTVFPHQMFGITGLNPLNLVIAATFVSYLGQALRERSATRLAPGYLFWLYLAPIVVAGAMGLPHATEIPSWAMLLDLVQFNNPVGYVRDMVARPLFLVLFALLVGAAAARSKEPLRLLGPMVVSVWVIGLLVIGFVIASGASLSELAGSNERTFLSPLGIHANELGRLYTVAYALCLFTWARSRDVALRFVLVATMALVVVALALTFSRGAFLGFLIVNALFLLWHRNALTWIFGGLALALLLWKLPGAIADRATMGFGSDLNTISAGRLDEIWIPLMPTFWDSPLFGHGLGSILWSAPLKSGQILQVSHPHNAYLQALLDIGIVGTVLVLAFFVRVWRGFRRMTRDASLNATERGFFEGAAAGLAAFGATAIAGSSLTPAADQCFLWFAVGMMYGLSARQDGRAGKEARGRKEGRPGR
jgi:O-antigen ligase